MKHQGIIRDLCWIRCFCCFSVKSTVLFSEKRSLMKSAALFMKSTTLFSEKRNSMKSAAIFMKSAMLFSEKCNSTKSAMKSTTLFSEKHNSMKSNCAFQCAFQQNFMSFGAITKYRSFVIYERPIRQPEQISGGPWATVNASSDWPRKFAGNSTCLVVVKVLSHVPRMIYPVEVQSYLRS